MRSGNEDQVAVVVGASSGIGATAATAFAAAGFRVITHGRNIERLSEVATAIERDGGTVLLDINDVSSAAGAQSVFDHALEAWGRVDAVVNCAGISATQGELGAIPPDVWDAVIGTNLTGAFLLANAVIPVMRSQGAGTIVNVSSLSAIRPMPLSTPQYAVSKAGVNMLTEWINMAEGKHGIRACAVMPGAVNTPMLERRRDSPTPETLASALSPADVADMCLYVATRRPGVRLNAIQMTSY